MLGMQHREERRKIIKHLCLAFVIVFWLNTLHCTGWLDDFLAQLSDRIHHFTAYNLMPLAFLTKLSNMH